jgi:hypothetical protein
VQAAIMQLVQAVRVPALPVRSESLRTSRT